MLRGVVTGVLSAILLNGCVLPGGRSQSGEPETFAQALHACRESEPGRLDRRHTVPADRPSVQRCLARKGWHPDGSPRLDNLLGKP